MGTGLMVITGREVGMHEAQSIRINRIDAE
jgi:hypothetical protein